MVKYSAALLGSVLLATSATADSWSSAAAPVCKVVTVTYTGDITWVPDPTWSDWVTSTKPVKPTTVTETETWSDWTTDPATSTETWSDWTETTVTKSTTKHKTTVTETETTWADWTTTTTVDPTWKDWTTTASTVTETETTWADWTTTTTTVDPTWSDWTTTTTTVDPTWSDWTTTTTTPTTTPGWTTEPTTTTSTAPVVTASCPASAGTTVEGGGSCGCGFTVNCASQADTSGSPVFWQLSEGMFVDTLAQCVEICDNNFLCLASIWVDDPTSSDYHLCWQTNGLGPVIGTGVGQISYKGTCTGTCTSNYED